MIIHANVGTYKILQAPAPSLDPAGFDEITQRILIKLNGNGFTEITNAFALGTAFPGHSEMYCIGPQGAGESLPGGYMKINIGWKGFLDNGSRQNSLSWAITTRETEYPITGIKANGTPYTVYADSPWAPARINPATGAYYRVRLTERQTSVRMQGTSVGTAGTLPEIPKYSGTAPPESNDWNNLPDPTISYPTGWVLKNYEVTSQYVVKDKALYFWTAYFEHVSQKGP